MLKKFMSIFLLNFASSPTLVTRLVSISWRTEPGHHMATFVREQELASGLIRISRPWSRSTRTYKSCRGRISSSYPRLVSPACTRESLLSPASRGCREGGCDRVWSRRRCRGTRGRELREGLRLGKAWLIFVGFWMFFRVSRIFLYKVNIWYII